MTSLIEPFANWLADYYLLSGALLLLSLSAITVIKQPAHRRAVTQSTLIALFVLAALGALPGWSTVSLMERRQPPPRETRAVQPLAANVDRVLDVAPTAQFEVARQSPAAGANPTPAEPPARRPFWQETSWSSLAVTGWALGGACTLIWLTAGSLAVSRLRRSAQIASADLAELIRELTDQCLRNGRQVELLTSVRIDVAVALGIWRPTVLLPAKWIPPTPLPFREAFSEQSRTGSGEGLSTEELRTILAHEAAHIRNHDLHWLAVSRALTILLWAQPFYWLLRRRMRLDQEALADAAAAELTGRQRYAEQLVAWARGVGARPALRLSSAVGLWEGPSQLRQRVALLLDEHFTMLRQCPRRWQVTVVSLCAVAALGLSLVTLEPVQSEPVENPQSVQFQLGKRTNSGKTAAEESLTAQRSISKPVPNTIAGVAVDETGQPIAGAKVTLSRVNRHDASRKELAQKTTDADGKYRFDNVIDIAKEYPDGKLPPLDVPGDEFLHMMIRAPGRASETWIEPPPHVAQFGDYQITKLGPAATLRGRVTDPGGRPVAGALVSLGLSALDRESAKFDRTDADGNYVIDDDAPFDIEKYRQQQEAERRRMEQAERAGSPVYSLFNSPPVLRVEHPDFAVKRTDFENIPGTKNVQLEPAASLAGRVVYEDSGKPAGRILVHIGTSVAAGQRSANTTYSFHRAAARTNAEGEYVFEMLPAGKYDVWAENEGWIDAGVREIDAPAKKLSSAPILTLVKGVVVGIRLIHKESREPIDLPPDARVTVGANPLRFSSMSRPGVSQFIAANANGEFELRTLPGQNRVWVAGVTIDGEMKYVGIEPAEINVGDGKKNSIELPVVETNAAPVSGVFTTVTVAKPRRFDKPREAVEVLTQTLKDRPDDADALLARAEVWHELGEYAKAVADYERLIELKPAGNMNAVAHNNLAYLLSTAPDDSIRNGKRAVELAERAKQLQPDPSPDVFDTLAAAYAEAGDFDKAIESQQKAIELARDNAAFREHLNLYENKQPLRDKPPAANQPAGQLAPETQTGGARSTPSFAPAAPAEDDATSTASPPSIPMETLSVRVTDEAGIAIQGATVTPYGMRSGNDGAHYGWYSPQPERVPPKPSSTDGDGIAKVRYPRYVYGRKRTDRVSLMFAHPEHVSHTQDVPVGESAFPVRLGRGGVVEIRAFIGEKPVQTEIFGLGGVWNTTGWQRLEDGTLRSPRLAAWPTAERFVDQTPDFAGNGTTPVRAVWLPKNGPPHFSAAVSVDVRKDETTAIRLKLQPGTRLIGKLDDAVPRPIKNGHVMAVVDSSGNTDWHDWAPVQADGTFEFAALPRDDGAAVQLVAICDGFVSKSPSQNEDDGHATPQTVALSGEMVRHEMEMIPTATAVIKLRDADGKPIAGANVSLNPNVTWTMGSNLFAASPLLRSSDTLREPDWVARHRRQEQSAMPYQAISDNQGIARVANLPPLSRQWVFVSHEEFELPQSAASYPGPVRFAAVELQPGTVVETEFVMQPKDTVAATQEVDASELAGRVLGPDRKPLAGVTVDAWTWYRGNETKTDAEGRFRLKGFEPKSEVEIEFRKAGFEPRYFYNQQAGTSDWSIQMDNRTLMEGHLTDPEGNTVAGATIRAERGPFINEQVTIGEVATETRTDKDGYYRLYLEPDTYAIKVRVPERGAERIEAQTIAAGEQKFFNIRLQEGITFRARIIDIQTGKPAEGIMLWNWHRKDVQGVSNADGLLEIPAMFHGNFEFSVSAVGVDRRQSGVAGNYARWWSEEALKPHQRKGELDNNGFQRNFDYLEFNVSADAEPVTIYVEQCVTVTGRVVDPDGTPVKGATVAPAKTGSGNSLTGDTRFSYETKADGTFEMKLPASGLKPYNLIAHDGKYGEWRKWANAVGEPFTTLPGDRIEDIELRLTRPATIRGQVLIDGEPASAGREVRAADFDNRANRYYVPTTKTDDTGQFELKFVGPGKHYIQVEPMWLDPSQAPAHTSTVVEVKEGDTIEDVRIGN